MAGEWLVVMVWQQGEKDDSNIVVQSEERGKKRVVSG